MDFTPPWKRVSMMEGLAAVRVREERKETSAHAECKGVPRYFSHDGFDNGREPIGVGEGVQGQQR